jgi:hypothetical protein
MFLLRSCPGAASSIHGCLVGNSRAYGHLPI